MELVFLSVEDVEKIHASTLSKSGKANIGLLEGALARVKNLHYYENVDDIYTLAAMYLIGIAKAHAFHDGNKRTAFQAASIFLTMNESELINSLLLLKLTVFAAMGEANLEETAFALKLLSDYGHSLIDDPRLFESSLLFKLMFFSHLGTVTIQEHKFILKLLSNYGNELMKNYDVDYFS